MKLRGGIARFVLALVVAFSALPATAASAATRPEGVVVVTACHQLRASSAPTDGQYTLSAGGDLFEISESTQITNTSAIAGISWARWDRTGRYTSYRDPSYLALTCNGDLQFWHAPGTMLWHSGTAGSRGARLIINNEGELRLYTADWSHLVWRSRSGQRYLGAGSILPSGGRLASGGADHHNYVLRTLVMQRDGNLVYRVGGVVRWQTGTHVAGSHAALNAHAQLVVIGPAGHVRWSSKTTGHRDSVLDVEFMRVDDCSYGVCRTIWHAPGVS